MPDNLKNLQMQFQNCLIHFDKKIESSIQFTENFNVQERLSIYSDGYRLRLLGILAKDFPVLKFFLGEEKFDNAALHYLDTYPSSHYSLYQFGRNFSIFLKSYLPHEPLVGELATFERALSDVLLAGNGKRIGVNTLLDLKPEEWPSMTLTLHPAVQSLHLNLNVPDFWRALQNKQPLPAVTISPSKYLIWRFHLRPYFCSLTPQQLRIFTNIQKGLCFAEVCEDLIGHLPEEQIGSFVADVLRQWLSNGMFIQ